jgi:hypothetical protein
LRRCGSAPKPLPLGLLLLSGPIRTIEVLGVWFSALGGVALSVAWIAAP